MTVLDIEPVVDELVSAELIDQVGFTPRAEYAFHHPLIRAVAYESQLKSDRAELHRRLAAAIEAAAGISRRERRADRRTPRGRGRPRAAYGWHMRAATWSTHRDIAAARVSWERARQIADALPEDDSDRTAMRIAPRTMLCGVAGAAGTSPAISRSCGSCVARRDKASLAIGMTGMATDHMMQARA